MSFLQRIFSEWSTVRHFYSSLAALRREPEQPDGNDLLTQFLARCRSLQQPKVLELGTRQSVTGRSTRHDAWVPHAAQYVGTDIAPGEDVDIIADVHRLTETMDEEQFDVIISCSTFEHFKYPHLAAHEIMKALKVGGIFFIQTHQTFPLHSHPYDYFRFSREALSGLFGTQMGVRIVASDYEFPARVATFRERALSTEPAFLNVRLYGEKVAKTPTDYIYEFDVQLPEQTVD